MCGIAGFVGRGDPDVLAAMSETIAYRGPDDCGSFVADGIGLAHRRLSIIDLSPAGHQPMISPEGDVLVFNGEIYNFREIRADLERRGHSFVSQSDSEVILRAYREWGEACLRRFRGMFAFALWDAGRRRLFAARDRVGIKPFYYLEHDGVFYLASEAKSLLTVPGCERRLNRRALPYYLSFRFTPGEATLFQGIRKLLPGHYLLVEPGGKPRIARYWELDFEPDEHKNETQWRDLFWDTFQHSVKLRLVSDLPVGAYLSGGLDSSLIVAAMSEITGEPIDAFSVGFADKRSDEIEYAHLVAHRFACRHHVLHAESEAAGILDAVTWHLDEPVADLASLPTYLMAKATKPEVTVVLSGEGADEMLAGYPKYRAMIWGRRGRFILPSPVWNGIGNLARNLTVKRMCQSQGEQNPTRAYLALAAVFSESEMSDLLTWNESEVRDGWNEVERFVRKHMESGGDQLSNLLSLDFHSWLPDDLLVKNDRMTMAHAVEARVPYLDHELVELCARIPSRFKIRWLREKVLLRKVMARRLPAAIVRRRKSGFSVPLGKWYSGEFKRRVDHALAKSLSESGLFHKRAIGSIRQMPIDHLYGKRQFWTLAAFALWQERFDVY